MNNNQTLVKNLISDGVLRTPAIIEAFYAIDRSDFVSPESVDDAYKNIPLPIGHGQTISQPYTVAYTLELLQPKPNDNILDIGYGSGWQTSLLAHLVGQDGHVTALEVISELQTRGEENIAKYNFLSRGIVECHCLNGAGGYEQNAPFDKIVGAAAAREMPKAWMRQTKTNGRIVAPVGSSIILLNKKSDEEWEKEEHPGFVFVPLT